MQSVVQNLSVQVGVALRFLDASSTDPLNIRKAFHSINAIHELIHKVNIELSQIDNQKKENEKLLASVKELSSKLSTSKLSENINRSDIKTLQSKINHLDIALKKVIIERDGFEKTISILKKEHKKEIESVRLASKEKSLRSNQKQKDKVIRLTELEQALRREIKSLKSIIDSSFGREATSVDGVSDGVRFFLHLYERRLPMVLRNDIHKIKILENVPWHFQVMRNNGVAVIALASEWLTPIFPSCADFDNEWLEKNSFVLHELMMARAKESHPLQYKITLAAKGVSLANEDLLLDCEKQWLKAANMDTLFEAISLGFQIFLVILGEAVQDLEYEKVSALFNKLLLISDKLKSSHAESEQN